MILEDGGFPTIETAAKALADDLGDTLRSAIRSRGSAMIAVSGGRTPRHVFRYLRQVDLRWDRVTVTLTDERWLSADHPESNEQMVRSCLLQGRAAASTFIPMFGGEDSPEAGHQACEARLARCVQPFDAIYLGFGGDGHFASLFPGDSAIDATADLCVPVPGTETRLPRMSLTSAAILSARRIFILYSGADKHKAYAEAKRNGSHHAIPLRKLLSQDSTPVSVWSTP